MSQTSVSRGITKLKQSFGDQLFIRKAHGLEPSELAVKLAEVTTDMLSPLEHVFYTYLDFEPRTYAGRITILVNTFILEFYGPQLILVLSKVFPCASFTVSQWQKDSISEVLSGRVDYVIQFASYQLPPELYCHSLAKMETSIIARKDHPVLSLGSEWERIHTLPIIRLFLDGINPNKGVLESVYEAHGYKANFKLVTHSVGVATALLKHSDTILYSSPFVCSNDPQLASYALPPVSESFNLLDVNGFYLASLRGNPLSEALRQTIQAFFDSHTFRQGVRDDQ